MADRSRRERQAKPDKFAALRRAREGGRREWKVSGSTYTIRALASNAQILPNALF